MTRKKRTVILTTIVMLNESKEIVELDSDKKKKSNEVIQVVSNVPPITIIQEECSKDVIDSFLNEKLKNFFVADRIASKIRGDEPKFQVPPHLDSLVKALAAFHNATYNLIYECWDYLKQDAVREQLIPDNAQPKDFYKLILEAQYIDTYSKLQNDTRSAEKQLNSQQKKIARDLKHHKQCALLDDELARLVMPINDLSKSKQENKEIANAYQEQRKKLNHKAAALQRSWLAEYETLSRFQQLLIDVADAQSKKSSVIATATDFYRETIKDKLSAEYEHFTLPFLKSIARSTL